MADDLDVEALLEAPFRKDGDEVSVKREAAAAVESPAGYSASS